MRKETRQRLVQLAEPSYKDFSAALIPGEDTMLGIRLPKLRGIAGELAKGNWQEELQQGDVYFEEVMLRGMVISYATMKMSLQEALPYIEAFIPCVTNWSVCDSVFMKMDVFQKDRDLTWEFIQPYLKSGEEFQVRVALIIMMQHLLKCDEQGRKIPRVRRITMDDLERETEQKKETEEKKETEQGKRPEGKNGTGRYTGKILQAINRPFEEGYYAHMAAAWLVAEAFCCFPAAVDDFLTRQQCGLDTATYNKALQKIVESKIPTEEVKTYIRSLKRRELICKKQKE